MIAKTLVNSVGPLPISMDFQVGVDGSVVFALTCTAWTTSAPCQIGVKMILDGVDYFSEFKLCAAIYANESSSHKTLPTAFFPVDDFAFGEHSLQIVALNDQTVTDENDTFQLTLFY